MTTLEQRDCAECGEPFHVECGPGIFISHRIVCDKCRGKPDVLGYADIKFRTVIVNRPVKAGDLITTDDIMKNTLEDLRTETDGIYRDLARRYEK